MANDKKSKRSLELAYNNLMGRTVRKPPQGIKRQVIETHFFRAENGDSSDGGPGMPIIRVTESGGIMVLGAIEEWWGSVYDPVMHAGGYLLRVIAGRRWGRPWQIEQANIFPMAVAVAETD